MDKPELVYYLNSRERSMSLPLPLRGTRGCRRGCKRPASSARMVAGRSFTKEYESPVALERLWKAGILHAHVLMPKLLPELVAGVDVVEGDGGVGTVTQFNFTGAATDQKFVRDRIDVIDSENHVFKYTVIDGGLLGSTLKSYSYELRLEEAAGGGSKGKVTVDYDTVGDSPLTDEEIGQLTFGLVGMMNAVEAFLQANPDQYV